MLEALSVAKELIRLSYTGEEPDPLTHLRLQKLLYYAQAWSLIVRESQLYEETIEAWKFGPVLPTVYRRLARNSSEVLNREALDDVPDLPAAEAEYVKHLWESYRDHSASGLSARTHQESPWLRAREGLATDEEGIRAISLDDVEQQFAEYPIPKRLVAYRDALHQREREAERILADRPHFDPEQLRKAANSHAPAEAVPKQE